MSPCGLQTQVEVRIWWAISLSYCADGFSQADRRGCRQLPVLAEEASTVWSGIVIHAWNLGEAYLHSAFLNTVIKIEND